MDATEKNSSETINYLQSMLMSMCVIEKNKQTKVVFADVLAPKCHVHFHCACLKACLSCIILCHCFGL